MLSQRTRVSAKNAGQPASKPAPAPRELAIAEADEWTAQYLREGGVLIG
jgi:hypothetical protein